MNLSFAEPSAHGVAVRMRTGQLTDIRRTRAGIIEQGFTEDLAQLRRSNGPRVLAALLYDCGLIALSVFLCQLQPLFLPLSLLLVGMAQRGMGNLLHEAGHGNISRNARLNHFVGHWLLALPGGTTLRLYRDLHNAHHTWLGAPTADPDFIHEEVSDGTTAWTLFRHNAFRIKKWLGSIFGNLEQLALRDQLAFCAWWLVVPCILGLLFGAETALWFIGLWFAGRATVFHAITVFREMTDHVGLEPGGIYSFSRNAPGTGLLRYVFHPHENGWHLVHHLLPKVPFHRLRAAHSLLCHYPDYREAYHCDGYFSGKRPVTRCWTGVYRRKDSVAMPLAS